MSQKEFRETSNYLLFQGMYPMLTRSDIRISLDEKTFESQTIFMDGLDLPNSYWQLSHINLNMINCNAAFLILELKYSRNVTIDNCTFGNWTFKHVCQISINNCSNTIETDFLTSINFDNSTGLMENITIKDQNFTRNSTSLIVQNYSYIWITKANFFNNIVNHGVINVLSSSTVLISNCTFENNEAKAFAGAIYAVESYAYVKNTQFNNNKAVQGGGALLLQNKSFIQITDSNFKNNQVNFSGGVVSMLRNGSGGAIWLDNSTAQLVNVHFTRNKANIGGAIYFLSESKLNAKYIFFYWNIANLGSAVFGSFSSNFSCKNCLCYKNIVGMNYSFASSIEIFNHSVITVFGFKCERQTGNISSCISASNYCSVSVYNSTFSMNNGSALLVWNSRHLVVAHSSFFNNSTPAIGGAIYSYNSTMHVSHSLFYNNNAFYGGGASILKYSSGNLINCTFYNNSSPIYGGAIAIDENSILNISHSTFLKNFGGLGGAVSATGSSLSFINCSFSENAAILPKDYYTNPIYKKYNLGAGGVIFIQDGVLKLFQSQFYNCFAHDIGGSVFSGWSTLSIHKTLFQNNFAGSLGGAIGILQNSSLTIEDSLLMNNSLLNKGNGGGLFINVNSTLIMSNVHLIDNKATSGGAIYSTYVCQITIFNSLFEGNTGSATWFEINVLVQISNCQFLNNSVSDQGAAIYVASSSIGNLTDTVFSYNMANTMGGAFYVEKGADAYFQNCSFTFNSAYNGGALAAVKSDVHLTACTFIRNNAMKGGVFYM